MRGYATTQGKIDATVSTPYMGVNLTDERCSESRDRDIETDATGTFIPIRSTTDFQGKLRLLTRKWD